MKVIAIRLIVLLTSSVITLGAVELILRAFFPQVTYFNARSFSFACFEEGIYRWIKLLPNRTCQLRSLYGAFRDVEVTTNSQGLREREITLQKPADTTRILFIGDSFTMGWGVADTEAYPRLVETALRSRGISSIQTINAGVPVTGVSNYYLYLKNYGLKLHPDVIVVGFNVVNDLIDATHSEWVETDDEGLPVKVASSSLFVDESGRIRQRKIPLKYSVPILRDSHLFIFVATRLIGPASDYIATINDSLPCIFSPSCSTFNQRKAMLGRVFFKIKQLAETNGMKLLVVLIPTEYQVYDYVEPKYGLRAPFPDKGYPNRQWQQFFDEHDINWIDLGPALRDQSHGWTYFLKDDHWNKTGHRVIADVIADHLLPVLSEP